MIKNIKYFIKLRFQEKLKNRIEINYLKYRQYKLDFKRKYYENSKNVFDIWIKRLP